MFSCSSFVPHKTSQVAVLFKTSLKIVLVLYIQWKNIAIVIQGHSQFLERFQKTLQINGLNFYQSNQ